MAKKTFETAMAALGVMDPERESVRLGWSRSMAAKPGGTPACLLVDGLLDSARYCRLDDVSLEAIAPAVEAIQADENLREVVWHAYFQLTTDRLNTEWGNWPRFWGGLGECSGMLYLIVALASVPTIRQACARVGIPEGTVHDTCRQIACYAANHQVFFGGRPGLYHDQLSWLTQYIDARIFRLGRLEYRLIRYSQDVIACRRREDGVVILLSGDGAWYDDDGLLVSGASDPEASWQASLCVGDDEIVGHALSPKGFADRPTVCLSRRDWEIVFQRGDWCLDMHIPSGGGMTMDACRQSMADAFSFSDRHFPECSADAIVCCSWIFNLQFEALLPESNLAQLLQRCYIHPAGRNDRAGLYFVFGPDTDDLLALPRRTSLHRVMLSVLEGGGRLRQAHMFMHRDDLNAAFDNKVYRAMFPQAASSLRQTKGSP